ncbi:hypothetical protein CHGG_09368 [Chaetomium globosum CBS 148.51]|uniref:Uncharacterized protein n=1 Tax=Chaetomium globosum (strain ATCC 6205 / CBS 148.51 / DSM 1962 / NBRC 6347 / NRRL 1970) TaxID=306901 RepID=Q2GRN6_CHAGB|nr:uncharacterized protein CHGG_09368 [Chaetomium globosum CBS 148.51]EAQ85354.1 hypothetical protein CHGG_09368 [Chaetomium globosum CBS 148.51]
MGHTTTQAVESSHAAIKKYLVSSRADLKSATHGLPCRHILYRHLTGDEPVTIQQIHKHWWLWRPQEQQHVGDDDSRNPNVEVVGIMPMPDIPLDPRQVKGKGRPVGAIATPSAASRKKGAGVNSTKRLPSAFEYNIEDELTTAVPAPKQQQQQQQQAGAASTKRFGPAAPPPSTAPAALGLGQGRAIEGSSRIEQVQQGLRGRRRDAEWSAQTQTSVEDRIEDCIVVAMTSVKGATANSMVTSTKLGLQRLRQVGRDSYEPGTAAPRASGRFIDGLDALDPDIEDDHDWALAAAEVAAREDQEDAGADKRFYHLRAHFKLKDGPSWVNAHGTLLLRLTEGDSTSTDGKFWACHKCYNIFDTEATTSPAKHLRQKHGITKDGELLPANTAGKRSSPAIDELLQARTTKKRKRNRRGSFSTHGEKLGQWVITKKFEGRKPNLCDVVTDIFSLHRDLKHLHRGYSAEFERSGGFDSSVFPPNNERPASQLPAFSPPRPATAQQHPRRIRRVPARFADYEVDLPGIGLRDPVTAPRQQGLCIELGNPLHDDLEVPSFSSLQSSLQYAIDKLEKYLKMLDETPAYWAALILHPGRRMNAADDDAADADDAVGSDDEPLSTRTERDDDAAGDNEHDDGTRATDGGDAAADVAQTTTNRKRKRNRPNRAEREKQNRHVE